MTAWVLEGASPEQTEAFLAAAPAPVRLAYRDEWQPAFAATDLWAAPSTVT